MTEVSAATSVSGFAVDLLKRIGGSEENVFFSPHSIAVALAMVRAGAKGKTADEIDAVLRLSPEAPARFRELTAELAKGPKAPAAGHRRRIGDVPEFTLSIANGLFSQSGWAFKESFRSAIGADDGAELLEVDFRGDGAGTRAEINGWVSEKTAHRIEEIVPPGLPTPDTRMLLANAIHYKARWLDQFAEEATREAPFKIAGGRKVTAKRMRQTGDFVYRETPDARIAKIPYGFATS